CQTTRAALVFDRTSVTPRFSERSLPSIKTYWVAALGGRVMFCAVDYLLCFRRSSRRSLPIWIVTVSDDTLISTQRIRTRRVPVVTSFSSPAANVWLLMIANGRGKRCDYRHAPC